MGNRALAPLRIAALLWLVVAVPAQAIDFAPLSPAFVESFESESSPTTAEFDLLGADGLIVDGTFSATAAHMAVSLPSDIADTASANVDTESVSTVGSDVGMAAEFEGMGIGSNGELLTGSYVVVSRLGGSPQQLLIGVTVIVTRTGGSYSATLYVSEENLPSPGTLTSTSVALSASDALAIGTGAPFRVEFLLDESAGTLVGSIDVNGSNVATTSALAQFDDHTLSGIVVLLAIPAGGSASSGAADLTRLEIYAQSHAYQPFLNIDVSAALNVPGSSYAAAGGAGFWNIIGTSVAALDDVDGNASGVTVDLDTASVTIGEGASPPDDVRLLGDYGFDCADPDEWSLDFSGLPDGAYRVLVYAPSSTSVSTGDIEFDGDMMLGSLPGSSTSTLAEGTSWASAQTVVTGGTLLIAGTGTGGTTCAGIAGVQLELAEPVPKVPSLALPGLAALSALLLFGGWRRRAYAQR